VGARGKLAVSSICSSPFDLDSAFCVYRDSAQEILTEYFARIGGRQAIFDETDKALKTKKRGRSTGGGGPSVDSVKRSRKNGVHPADTTPPATTTKKWSPPAGSWEDEIESIDACEDGGSGKLTVYLIWKNGQKTKHDTSVIYKKCPQKVRATKAPRPNGI
jgi:chromobox protein 1